MATGIKSSDLSPTPSPSGNPPRPSSAPEPAIAAYRGLSPETKSLAKQVFNSENDIQADGSSFYDCGLDWLLNAIAESEKLNTTPLRRGSLAANVELAHVAYKAIGKDNDQMENSDSKDFKAKANASADELVDLWNLPI